MVSPANQDHLQVQLLDLLGLDARGRGKPAGRGRGPRSALPRRWGTRCRPPSPRRSPPTPPSTSRPDGKRSGRLEDRLGAVLGRRLRRPPDNARDAAVAGGRPPRPGGSPSTRTPGSRSGAPAARDERPRRLRPAPAVLEVVGDDELRHPVVFTIRRHDHARAETLVASRVGGEGRALTRAGRSLDGCSFCSTGGASAASCRPRRHLRANMGDCTDQAASARRLCSPTDRAQRPHLRADRRPAPPGAVLLRLAARGFGERLPPP